jgi:hypothetical protein
LKAHNHLQEIILELAKAKVDFIICGGVALVLHGVERMTMGLDITIDMSEKNLTTFLHTMRRIKLQPRAPVPADSLLDPEKRKLMIKEKNALVFTFIDTRNPYRQVDLFISDDISFDKLMADGVCFTLGHYKINMLSKEKLLAMKEAIKEPREKDLFDIKALKNILGKKDA